MTHNVRGLAMLGDLKIVRPEPLPIEKQMYKITYKCLPMFVLPEQLLPCCMMKKYLSSPIDCQALVCVQRSCLCDESSPLDGRRRATFTIKPVVCCVALRSRVVNDATGASVSPGGFIPDAANTSGNL